MDIKDWIKYLKIISCKKGGVVINEEELKNAFAELEKAAREEAIKECIDITEEAKCHYCITNITCDYIIQKLFALLN